MGNRYEQPNPSPREGADNVDGHPREGGFAQERGIGHVPGQRWSGGYGGDGAHGGAPGGRGFPGSDFAAARDGHAEPRRFGNEVDRAGRGPHYGTGPKGYKRSDTRVHEEVCEAIAHQGHIDASDVEVKVSDGVVTLTGTVTHSHDRIGLERLVERTRGVDEVKNELRLS